MNRCQILLENEINTFKKLVSRRKHEVLQHFLVNGCSDVGFQKTQWTNSSRWHCTPNHHRLWKPNTGLQATWALSFSTLLQEIGLQIKYKTGFQMRAFVSAQWSNSPVLLLLSPGKTPLTATVAKFLDTSVCGGSWRLDPSLSPVPCEALDNPHKAAALSVGFASFLQHFFFTVNFLLTMLGYSTLWTVSFFAMWIFVPTLPLKCVNDCLLENCQISSLPHDCVA